MINKKRRKKRRVCQFCASKDARIDYKNTKDYKSTSLKEVKYYQEEYQVLVQNIKEN